MFFVKEMTSGSFPGIPNVLGKCTKDSKTTACLTFFGGSKKFQSIRLTGKQAATSGSNLLRTLLKYGQINIPMIPVVDTNVNAQKCKALILRGGAVIRRPSELLTSAHSEIRNGLYDDSDICSFTVTFLIKHNYK